MLFLLQADPAAPAKVAALFERGLLASVPLLDTEAGKVLGLMKRHQDVGMSLADACLVRLAERLGGCHILTTDSDFLVYRKNRKEKLELLAPPGLKRR